MKRILAAATIVIVGAAGHPFAASVMTPVSESAANFAYTAAVEQHASEAEWTGRWQGTTVSGVALMLQLQLQGERLAGRLTVGKQSAKIVYGKVVGQGFALTTDPIDGHSVDATGRHLGDAIELTIEGVKDPLTLTRTK